MSTALADRFSLVGLRQGMGVGACATSKAALIRRIPQRRLQELADLDGPLLLLLASDAGSYMTARCRPSTAGTC